MLKAAEYWATTRGAGRPTADEKALDGDVILAAQSAALVQPGDELVVATTNVGHLSQFVDARSWRESSDLRELRGGASGLCCPHPQLSPGQSP